MRVTRPFAVVCLLSAFAAAAMVVAPAAGATTPGYPSGLHVTAATSTSFTVGLSPTPYATSYQLYVARSIPALYVANINSSTKSATASAPSIPITGLAYTTAPYYYRVLARNATSHRWGTVIHPAGLRPATPSGLRAITSARGTYLSWNAQATGTGFLITQATNAAMTAGRTVRTVPAGNYLYSPWALSRGARYYLGVAARNVYTTSLASSVLSVVPTGSQSVVRVLTYNVLEASFVGTHEGGQVVPAWQDRRAGVAALIHQAQPGVAGIQEAAAWTTSVQGYGGRRQIDDLMTLMPDYALARTEVPPTEHGYIRTGNYIIYNKARFETVGTGGHWELPYTCWAAYQVMQDRVTGARFLFVVPHLIGSVGATYDERRQQETEALLTDAARMAGTFGVPTVYAGDFNSDTSPTTHTFDGPSIAMRAHHDIDARDAANYHYNERYNSANQYLRTPPAAGDDIDHVFVDPGVAVLSWGVLLNLHEGSFVGTIPSDHNPVWSTIAVGY